MITNSPLHPIYWDEELNAYVYIAKDYNGPSTKKIGRIASAHSLEHFKVRQLEKIADVLKEVIYILSAEKELKI